MRNNINASKFVQSPPVGSSQTCIIKDPNNVAKTLNFVSPSLQALVHFGALGPKLCEADSGLRRHHQRVGNTPPRVPNRAAEAFSSERASSPGGLEVVILGENCHRAVQYRDFKCVWCRFWVLSLAVAAKPRGMVYPLTRTVTPANQVSTHIATKRRRSGSIHAIDQARGSPFAITREADRCSYILRTWASHTETARAPGSCAGSANEVRV